MLFPPNILAKDGKLVRATAGSRTWVKTFFDETTERDRDSLRKLYLQSREDHASDPPE